MIAEGVLVDDGSQQQQQQQQMQQQMQQPQQTAMAPPPPMQSGPMNDPSMQSNGNRKTRQAHSGDGCCDNARERTKDAVKTVAPCISCKLRIYIRFTQLTHFHLYFLKTRLREFKR
jgi:hypothetical protein